MKKKMLENSGGKEREKKKREEEERERERKGYVGGS